MFKVTLKQGKRLIILIVGMTVVIIGMFMIVLPGPATIVIPTGLGILAIEFAWARKWLDRIKSGIGEVANTIREKEKGRKKAV